MLAAAAIVVLLVVLLAMNSVAIWLRNRYHQRDGDLSRSGTRSEKLVRLR